MRRKAFYSLAILLLALVIVMVSSSARTLLAQSTPAATTAATEDQSSCSVKDPILQIAFSPDGKYVVANWKSGTARLWEVETGKVIRDFPTLPDATFGPVDGITFSPDGKYLLTLSWAETAIVSEVATGRPLYAVPNDPQKWGQTRSVAFSADGKYILIGFDAGGRVWDAQTGASVGDFRNGWSEGAHAQFFPDSKRVLIDGGDVTIWDIEKGERLFTSDDRYASLSPDGRYFLTYNTGGDGGGGPPGDIQLWDAERFTKLHTVTGDYGEFSPNGKYLWTGADQELAVWETGSGSKLLSSLRGWRGYFFHKNDYVLITDNVDTPGNQMKYRVWDIKAGKDLWNYVIDEDQSSYPVISPDDKYIMVGEYYRQLRLRDIQTGKIIRKFC